jgi:hypothetical protein
MRDAGRGANRRAFETGSIVPVPVVATVIENGTPTPFVTFIDGGTVQVAAVGAPPHPSDTLPVKPGVSCRL